jgi:phenylpyruvate tautomerase PptA (4-oxalocrotonate tautomerase family)
MPFVRIALRQGTSPEYRKALADGVHRAMVETIAIPPDDRFQVITDIRWTDSSTILNTSAFIARIAWS